MGPHFLCIGAPRCGTTRMHLELGRHPQIQELPGKELYSLDERKSMLLSRGKPFEPRAARVKTWAARWQRRYAKAPRRLEWGLKWLDQYSQGGKSLDAYMALFEVPAGKIAGDMSPNLCRLAPAEVRAIRNRLGDIRVFMLTRDPIERDWSHAKLMLQYEKTDIQQSDEEYIRYIGSNGCQSYSNYVKMIDIWSNNFTSFRIFYLDDIAEKPQEMMHEVCEFLNIDPNAPQFSNIAPNPASTEMGQFVRTPKIYEAQKRISEPLMAELKARLGGHPAAWHDRHFGSTPTPHNSLAMSDSRDG